MSSAIFCAHVGHGGIEERAVARQAPRVRRVGRRLQRTNPDARPRAGASDRRRRGRGMSRKLLVAAIPRADAGLVRAALRLPAVVDHRERPVRARRRQLDDVLRVGEHGRRRCSCRRPNTSRCCRTPAAPAGAGWRTSARQNACSAANADSPACPARETTSQTSSARSPSCDADAAAAHVGPEADALARLGTPARVAVHARWGHPSSQSSSSTDETVSETCRSIGSHGRSRRFSVWNT